jgi:hypothetical protein
LSDCDQMICLLPLSLLADVAEQPNNSYDFARLDRVHLGDLVLPPDEFPHVLLLYLIRHHGIVLGVRVVVVVVDQAPASFRATASALFVCKTSRSAAS